LGGISGKRSKNLLITHSGAGHPLELLGGVELKNEADIRAKENLASRLRKSPQLLGRDVHAFFEVLSGRAGVLDLPQRERRCKCHVSCHQAVNERRTPRYIAWSGVPQNIHPTPNRYLGSLIVGHIFGGIMPALLYLVNVVSDAGALMIVRGANFLSAFDQPQQDALVVLLLRLHDYQNTAAEILWGTWLFPLAALVYKSRFMPRFLGVWLGLNGFAYVILSFTGFLLPQFQGRVFLIPQPAMFGELALMLWLVVKGAKPTALNGAASSSTDA
jgi:hypothetical protein